MMRSPLSAAGVLALLASSPGMGTAVDRAEQPLGISRGRLPDVTPFAPRLAQRPMAAGATAWPLLENKEAWGALSRAGDRQAGRWAYARNLIGRNLGQEALGVLAVMRLDEPDLDLVEPFRVARGAAMTLAGRRSEAVMLLAPGSKHPERCAWQARALAGIASVGYEQAFSADTLLRSFSCAGPALAARDAAGRAPFLLAIADALTASHPQRSIALLTPLSDRDPAANLVRGKALAALGRGAEARLRFERAEVDGPTPLRMAARLSRIEAGVNGGSLSATAGLRQLTTLRYGWHGDAVEEGALQLGYRWRRRMGDFPGALSEGATLLRYFGASHQPPGFAEEVRSGFAAMVGPASRLPLDRAAGLLWNYRDMLPAGNDGDRLVTGLVDRLQAAGLYDRAAALLNYQLLNRAGDLARGPLSVRVASLFILSGRPGAAVSMLRRTEAAAFTPEMNMERDQMEAIALFLSGRGRDAVALLQDVADSAALRGELLWRQRRWEDLVVTMNGLLPRAGKGMLSEVDQTVVLRQGIALAMLGRLDDLTALHARYGSDFAGLSTAAAFDLIAGPAGAQPARLVRALASLPSASPAGSLADLLDAAAAAR